MNFVDLCTSKEERHVAVELIGYWSIFSHICDKCGADRYILEVYDRNGILLCSLIDTETVIRGLSETIRDEMKKCTLSSN